jgi:hypothetical protein
MRHLLLAALAASLPACGDPGPACDLTGTWMGSPVMGQFVNARVSHTFNADGTYAVNLNDATFDGQWALSGTRLTISNDGSCPTGSGDGVYQMNFSDCMHAILALVSDPCAGRSQTLNGEEIIKPF